MSRGPSCQTKMPNTLSNIVAVNFVLKTDIIFVVFYENSYEMKKSGYFLC